MALSHVAVLIGLIVGLLVGSVGIGAGSIVAPALVIMGLEPVVAVGTDLLYATITRALGVLVFGRMGHIRSDIAYRLLAGSLPAVLIGHYLLSTLPREILNRYITIFIGIILIGMSLLGIIREELHLPVTPKKGHAYLVGFTVGLIVQFTSVGAGVIVGFALINVARLNPKVAVGTVLLYSLSLSILSIINYILLQAIDYRTLLLLLTGGIPGVILGTRLSIRLNADLLKNIINFIILSIGIIIILI